MTGLPRVSICLLTYKRAHVLPRTLDLLLAQDYPDFELIINDDHSPDATEEIGRAYAQRDPRVRYYRNVRNLRYADNQNVAILRARSEYVALVHDSDLYRPHLLSSWTRALLAHPSAALVFNAIELMNHTRAIVRLHSHRYAPLIDGRAMRNEMLSSPHSPIFGIVMLRRSRVLETGPFDPRLPTLADVDMWLRLLAKYDAAYVKDPLYAIAPREVGHHNHYTNWNVRRESELIFELNWRRCFQFEPDIGEHARRSIARMLQRQRLSQFGACFRHLEMKGMRDGLRFFASQPPFGAQLAADSVTTWDRIAPLVEAQSDRPANDTLSMQFDALKVGS